MRTLRSIPGTMLLAVVLALGVPGLAAAGQGGWDMAPRHPTPAPEPSVELPPGSLSLGFVVPGTGGRGISTPLTDAEGVTVTERVVRGERLMRYGLYREALRELRAAREALPRTGPDPLLARLEQRLGNANWALFGQTGDAMSARLALKHWRWEHAWYRAYDTQPVARARAAYDIGRAHLALAAVEDTDAHVEAAATAFGTVATGLGELERSRVVALASGRLDPALHKMLALPGFHF